MTTADRIVLCRVRAAHTEGVVHNQRDLVLLRDGFECVEVRNVVLGVTHRLNVKALSHHNHDTE